MSNHEDLDAASISEVIQMALSDHVSFAQIRATLGLSPDQVKALMRQNLSPGSYRAWRRRVRRFGDQRQRYKQVPGMPYELFDTLVKATALVSIAHFVKAAYRIPASVFESANSRTPSVPDPDRTGDFLNTISADSICG
jgi:uncharacterized protein (TIGR03643 family)